MAYFPDLSPYAYGYGSHPSVVHVGWLDNIHPYPKGDVDAGLVQKLKLLASKPVELYRGKHICELCVEPARLDENYTQHYGILIDPNDPGARWIAERSSNGEIRVSRGGIIFAAPLLIIHNIEVHCYLPPHQFLQAVAEAPSL